jgi:hypothetical protein
MHELGERGKRSSLRSSVQPPQQGGGALGLLVIREELDPGEDLAEHLLLAVLTRHAVVVGLLYALIWESLVGSFVPDAQALSIQQWALAGIEKSLGDRAEALGVSSAVSLGVAIPLLLVVIAGATWFAGWRLRALRLTSDE